MMFIILGLYVIFFFLWQCDAKIPSLPKLATHFVYFCKMLVTSSCLLVKNVCLLFLSFGKNRESALRVF